MKKSTAGKLIQKYGYEIQKNEDAVLSFAYIDTEEHDFLVDQWKAFIITIDEIVMNDTFIINNRIYAPYKIEEYFYKNVLEHYEAELKGFNKHDRQLHFIGALFYYDKCNFDKKYSVINNDINYYSIAVIDPYETIKGIQTDEFTPTHKIEFINSVRVNSGQLIRLGDDELFKVGKVLNNQETSNIVTLYCTQEGTSEREI